MNSVLSNNPGSKYQMFTPSGGTDALVQGFENFSLWRKDSIPYKSQLWI